ncbi:hypothetical protein [Bradyrhizobium sp. McL0616]
MSTPAIAAFGTIDHQLQLSGDFLDIKRLAKEAALRRPFRIKMA